MKKYRKIITDRPLISDAEISSTKKGFNEMLSKFNSSLSGSSGGFSLGGWTIGLLSTVVLGVGIWYATSGKEDGIKGGNQQISALQTDSITGIKDSINPPLADKLVYEYFTIDNNKDVEIVTKNKNVIKIPANAFVDKDGKSISKNVKIKFNDYHNPLDIFLSGIPMGYDSSGTHYTFETAGMFQIFAENKSGENLYLADNKSIKINMNSKSVDPANIYYYDTIQNSWIYKRSEQKTEVTDLRKETKEIKKQIDEYAYEIGNVKNNIDTGTSNFYSSNTKEVVAKATEKRKSHNTGKKYILKLKDKNGDNKVIEIYPNQGFKDEYYSVVWSSTNLEKKNGNEYQITLSKGNTILSFLGKEVIDSKKEEIIQKINQKNTEKQQRILAQEKRAEKIENLRILQSNFNSLTSNGFYGNRQLTINSLGTWNCDRPIPYPEMALAGKCSFTDDQGKTLSYESIQISQIEKSILWKYPSVQNWYYSGNLENILWFITSDGRFAILYPNQFKEMKSQKVIAANVMGIDEGLDILKGYYN